jgi:hypothetical protein
MDEILRNYTPRKKLAAKLHRNERTLIEWEKDGKGPPVTRIGREVLYYNPSIEQWMRDQERQPRKGEKASVAARYLRHRGKKVA